MTDREIRFDHERKRLSRNGELWNAFSRLKKENQFVQVSRWRNDIDKSPRRTEDLFSKANGRSSRDFLFPNAPSFTSRGNMGSP